MKRLLFPSWLYSKTDGASDLRLSSDRLGLLSFPICISAVEDPLCHGLEDRSERQFDTRVRVSEETSRSLSGWGKNPDSSILSASKYGFRSSRI